MSAHLVYSQLIAGSTIDYQFSSETTESLYAFHMLYAFWLVYMDGWLREISLVCTFTFLIDYTLE